MNEFDFHNCLLFKGVDEHYIDEFLTNCETVTLHPGDFLFHQNDVGDAMYVVKQGELEVILDSGVGTDSQGKQVIGRREFGALIGEFCVFGQQKRSASIRALVESKLLKIEGEDFRIRIYSKDLDALLICYNITKLLSEQMIATNTLLTLHHPLKVVRVSN